MTIRPIIRYPDPRLAIPARAVTAFDDTLRELAGDLLETMHAAPGIGITAPHIGVPLRVVVLDLDSADGARIESLTLSYQTLDAAQGGVVYKDTAVRRHARKPITICLACGRKGG